MKTSKRLWLGFGAVAALLALSLAAIIVLLGSVSNRVEHMATVARLRSATARQLEINVLEFATGVLDYHETGSENRRSAAAAAAAVERHRAEYGRLARTPRQRDLAARFAAVWRESYELGQGIMDSENRQSTRADRLRFRGLRVDLERLLDEELQPDAAETYNAEERAALTSILEARVASITLLILGVVIALTTSGLVGRGVARTEAMLRESKAHLDSTLEAMQDGVGVFDMNGNVTLLNQALARINGFASAHEMKRNLAFFAEVYELFEADGRPLPVEQWPVSRVLRGETLENWEIRGRRKDTGQQWFFSFSGAPVFDKDGRQILALTITRDISDHRRAEEHLRQAQKMEAVGQLTAGIAHDFNNLLTVIIANAELLANALPEDAAEHEYLTDVLAAARRGATMTGRLLGFSRRGMLVMTSVRAGVVARGLDGTLRRLLPETMRIEITDATDPSDSVRADVGALEQILVNLCTNARDAMPKGGTLRIECKSTWLDAGYHATHPWVAPGAYVLIAVSDTGSGMDEETRRRIFEPFFTTKPADQGTGLGMAMVYGLMKQHGGMVQIYSEPGQGTVVKLYFPVATETPAALEPAAALPTKVPTGPGGSETILLAEDDAAIRRATKRALEARGYAVLTAEDGEAALELYRQRGREIALIISDLVMPKLGGRQLAEALRAEASAVPILFTSGYSPAATNQESAFPSGSVFLHKPWTLTDLLSKVRELLDQATGAG